MSYHGRSHVFEGRPSVSTVVESSNYLLNLQRKLSKLQQPAPGLPIVSPVLVRLDNQTDMELTRTKKSAKMPWPVDRMASEVYPMAPPRIDMPVGVDTRWLNRGKEIAWQK